MDGVKIMMDFLRNIISPEWWQNVFSQLTFADLQERWALIQEAIANPQQHPLVAMLALAIVLVFLLIVILTFAMWYYGRIQKQDEEYELLDEGENVVYVVDKETAEELLETAHGVKTQTIVNYAAILTSIAMILAVTVGFGFSTRTEVFCGACHESPHADVADWPLVTAHGDLTCFDCHEPGGLLQGVTLNLFPRAVHATYGVFMDIEDRDATNRTTYGAVTQASCIGCHDQAIFERTVVVSRPDRVTVRVSHYEPLEAGMTCVQCHLFSPAQEQQLIQTGMQTCVSCHNGTRASVACINCHMADSPADTIQRNMGTVWSRQLIFAEPDQSCYDCHATQSCDECHGTRVPHTPEYMMHVHVPGGEMIHAYDYWRIGDMCYNCHFIGNASSAGQCSECHGLAYVPPWEQQRAVAGTIIEPRGPGEGSPGVGRFTPRMQLTPRQLQILRDNNIDVTIPRR